MGRTLTEKKVLKKLGIDNFRQMTKEKVILMATMLDKMDPEVAKKALDQFPEFSKVSKDMLKEYKETLDKGLETNRESVQSFYEACNTNIIALQKMLEDETLSFEQKKYIIDKLLEISKMMGEKDTENKKFIATMAAAGAAAVGITVMALASVLGGNTKIQMGDSDDNKDEY